MQELLERGDRVRGQMLKPDAVVGDVLLKLRVALNECDQTFERPIGRLGVVSMIIAFMGFLLVKYPLDYQAKELLLNLWLHPHQYCLKCLHKLG